MVLLYRGSWDGWIFGYLIDGTQAEHAKKSGATDGVLSRETDWKKQVLALTDGLGVDVAIEAVGTPQTFAICHSPQWRKSICCRCFCIG